ncbi:hypothetical protein TSUD_376100 [Trifolium subterraneum]|uniref:Nucleosome assembly protein n=1 Tax=Trifolium subterraneum TaxID=3900 RepID=A0A2Z6M192_TRISU|nr:hypothetical protein TSUD_376100 [Trifolium subterraneum]
MSDHAVDLPAADASSSSSGLVNVPKDKRQIFARLRRKLFEAINCLKLLTENHEDMETLSPNVRKHVKALKYLQLLTEDMETLSPNVRKRVKVLKYLQNEYKKLVTKFFEEARQLEVKYLKLYEPLYTKRYEIVNGVIDVEGNTNEAAVGEEDKVADENGVPSFWLTAMKTNKTLAEEITERDEEALKYLKDIKWCEHDKPYNFKLDFYFDSNPYFQNSVLTKTYYVCIYDVRIFWKSNGTEIEWHPGKCLTHTFLKKPKKRSRNAKGIINTEKCESFFNFFNPPQIPEDDDIDDNAVEELYNLIKHDNEIGYVTSEYLSDDISNYFDLNEAVQKGSSPNVSQRVEVLKYLQNEYDKLETEAFEEEVQLDAKYNNLYEPLYKKRYEIVNGFIGVEGITNEAVEEKGVPRFWLTAMKNNKALAEEITERDKEALKYLKDIKWCRLCNSCIFKLEFYFDSNPFFQNSVLTKTYHIIEDGNPIVMKSTGTEIEWHPGKCLTHNFLKKPKKRSRNAKGIINTEKCESFFNFFNPPQIPEDDDDIDDDVEELRFLMERDYEICCIFRCQIIPEAVSWFTGKAGKGKSKRKRRKQIP